MHPSPKQAPRATRYLQRLPMCQELTQSARGPSNRRPVGRGALLVILTLLAATWVTTVALMHLLEVRPMGVSNSGQDGACLDASMDPLGDHAGHGQAAICTTEDGSHGSLDLEQLEPMTDHMAWIAYFEQSGLCSLAVLEYQLRDFHQPCTLTDLDGPDPRGTVQSIG